MYEDYQTRKIQQRWGQTFKDHRSSVSASFTKFTKIFDQKLQRMKLIFQANLLKLAKQILQRLDPIQDNMTKINNRYKILQQLQQQTQIRISQLQKSNILQGAHRIKQIKIFDQKLKKIQNTFYQKQEIKDQKIQQLQLNIKLLQNRHGQISAYVNQMLKHATKNSTLEQVQNLRNSIKKQTQHYQIRQQSIKKLKNQLSNSRRFSRSPIKYLTDIQNINQQNVQQKLNNSRQYGSQHQFSRIRKNQYQQQQPFESIKFDKQFQNQKIKLTKLYQSQQILLNLSKIVFQRLTEQNILPQNLQSIQFIKKTLLSKYNELINGRAQQISRAIDSQESQVMKTLRQDIDQELHQIIKNFIKQQQNNFFNKGQKWVPQGEMNTNFKNDFRMSGKIAKNFQISRKRNNQYMNGKIVNNLQSSRNRSNYKSRINYQNEVFNSQSKRLNNINNNMDRDNIQNLSIEQLNQQLRKAGDAGNINKILQIRRLITQKQRIQQYG